MLPVLVYGVPALLGHPVLPGDDLTQNFPLRVLAGQEIRSGHLPLYDPYIWSGAPLLAGWNAGAAYPFTFLFAVLPPVAAWTLNMILTWAIAGLGMFAFLRALRLACAAEPARCAVVRLRGGDVGPGGALRAGGGHELGAGPAAVRPPAFPAAHACLPGWPGPGSWPGRSA